MAISFNKKELEKKKHSKKLEKQKRKEERTSSNGKSFDDMIAYVDEFGSLTNTPPDLTKKNKVDVDSILISTPKKEDIIEPILKGRVEFINSERGYGFIKDLKSVEKYFFHFNNAPDEIKANDLVNFELERGKKGMNAINVIITK